MKDTIKTGVWFSSAHHVSRLDDLPANQLPEYHFTNLDMSMEGWIKACEVYVEINRPTKASLTSAIMATFDEAAVKINREAAAALARINQVRQNFLALTNSPFPVDDRTDAEHSDLDVDPTQEILDGNIPF